ncbi:hypothetical protein C1J03_09645 [Sulfitobacter sp. SK012]|uniref:hypothetical protein n=1 Tax=Sulfitobacter sp. SK012 TaxID=1389005 RepID=UPI000E0BCDE4|nr:hypothetical protein [Sulfitobacter sp. SK012]AXI46265.1 hypothetical protein C1J03_09645 [Sulfitobacter sp. SK012]
MKKLITQQSIRNLLLHCAKAQPGQRLLIAYEPSSFGFFSSKIIEQVAAGALELGLLVECLDVGFSAENPSMNPELLAAIEDADIVVFLARLGDQLRFSEMPKGKAIINSYTLNEHLLNSAFASAHYDAFLALKHAADRCIADAQLITITCPAGTSVCGNPNLQHKKQTDTALKRFPMSVFSPVPAQGFSGKVALAGFLTGTGSQYYDNYTVEFEGQVFAVLEAGRLAGFEGLASDVSAANAHYDRVAGLFEIDRNFVHSWHAGIHPGCGFPWNIRQDYERWGGVAFGNPRVLHFHTCGNYAPGEISWNALDPTIVVDGVTIWENGVFRADKLPEGPDILKQFPCAASAFAHPDRNIGLLEKA